MIPIVKSINKIYLSYKSIGIADNDSPIYIRKTQNANLVFTVSILLILVLTGLELLENKLWVMPVHFLRILALSACIYLLSRRLYDTSVRLGIYAIYLSSVLGTVLAPVQNSFHFLSFPICALSFYFNNRRLENFFFFSLSAVYFVVAQYYNIYHLPPDNSASLIVSLVIIFAIFYITTALFVSEFRFFQNLILSKNEELETINNDLKLKNEELEQLNRFKNDSISIISHDLKGPVGGMLGISTVLKRKYKTYPPEKVEQMIDILHYNLEKVNSMLIELLVWANSHSESIEIHEAEFEIAALCKKILQTNHHAAAVKKISLILNEPDMTQSISSDPVIVSIILRNLISNAIKYTPSGGQVEVSIQKHENMAQISVADEGTGISDEIIKKIESRGLLKSLPGTNEEAGHGIGLSICADLTKIIKAELKFSKKSVGSGTTAILKIPPYSAGL